MLGPVQQKLKKAFFQWSVRRSPRLKQLTLSQKRIYIMPSKAGFIFMGLLAIMLLLAINYQNNLIFGLTFLLGSLFIVAILHTYANLAGLTIHFVRGHPCFAGEKVGFDLRITRPGKREFESITLRWREGERSAVDLVEQNEVSLRLYQPTEHRGIHPAGALLVETYYPLGLFRAWTWLQADMQTVIYPRPIPGGTLPETGSQGSDSEEGGQPGAEEFSGLETYQPGMSLKRVAWKQHARGQGMHAKQYVDYSDSRCWLDWQYWPALDAEARLSRLTWWVLQLDRMGQSYGLRLPGMEIPPSRGEAHRIRTLEALACFDPPGSPLQPEVRGR